MVILVEIIKECVLVMFHSHAWALARVKNAGVSGATHAGMYLCNQEWA